MRVYYKIWTTVSCLGPGRAMLRMLRVAFFAKWRELPLTCLACLIQLWNRWTGIQPRACRIENFWQVYWLATDELMRRNFSMIMMMMLLMLLCMMIPLTNKLHDLDESFSSLDGVQMCRTICIRSVQERAMCMHACIKQGLIQSRYACLRIIRQWSYIRSHGCIMQLHAACRSLQKCAEACKSVHWPITNTIYMLDDHFFRSTGC